MSKHNPSFKVLIVEDSEKTAQSLAEMIDHFELECDIAADGCAAENMLRENSYFLVIADSHMPKVSGCELLKRIKADHPEIFVAVMSTNDTGSTRGLVVKNRADFYLPKPIKVFNVEEMLKAALAIRRGRKVKV